MNTDAIADLRKSYELAALNESESLADPRLQFERWLQEAITSHIPEPNAMTLATVSSDMRPSTRVVLIKGIDERGPVWYTNYQSRKGARAGGQSLRGFAVSLGRTGARCADRRRRYAGERRKKVMPISTAVHWTPASALGQAPKANPLAGARCW